MDWQQLAGVLGQQLPAQPVATAAAVAPPVATSGAATQPQTQLASLYYQQMLVQQLQTQQQALAATPGLQASQPQLDTTALQQLYGQQPALSAQMTAGLLGMPLQQAPQVSNPLSLVQQQSALLHQQILAAAAVRGQQPQSLLTAGASLLSAGAAQDPKFAGVSSASSSATAGQIYTGDIVDYDEQKGFGFIECVDTHKIYGIDIFLLRSALDGQFVNPGDKVNFQVEKGPKGPKAANVQVVQRIDEREDLTTFYGTIKRYDEQRSLGFIDCANTMELYGKDILVFKSQLGDSRNGAKVSFSIIKDARGVKAARVKVLSEFPPGVDPTKLTVTPAQDAGASPQPVLALTGLEQANSAATNVASGGLPPARFVRPDSMPTRDRSRSPKATWSVAMTAPSAAVADWKAWQGSEQADPASAATWYNGIPGSASGPTMSFCQNA